MKKNNFSGKTLEEAKISALENLKCNEEDIYIKVNVLLNLSQKKRLGN